MADEKTLIDLGAVKKRQRHYETIAILSPALAEPAFKDIFERNGKLLAGSGVTILRQDDWGKKRMAYPIERHAMGRYAYYRYIGTEEAVRALERSLKLDASVLRYQSVRLSEVLNPTEIQTLIETAPKEPSSAPAVRGEDDESSLDSSYS